MEDTVIKKKGPKVLTTIMAVVMVAAVALIVLIVVKINSPENKLKKQLEIADKYLAELNYDQAILAYKMALEIDPMSVEAYLGLAEGYVGWDDYPTALKVLYEAYTLTGDQRLDDRIKELEIIQAELEKTEVITDDAEKDQIPERRRIEETVVDGIIHHAYEEIDLTDVQQTYLDSIIEACEAGRLREAAELLDIDYEREVFDTDARVLYGDYKVCINHNMTTLIPVSDGKGFLLAWYPQWEVFMPDEREVLVANKLYWGEVDCRDSMFNGEFRINFCRDPEWPGIPDSELYATGTVENGLITGSFYDNKGPEGMLGYQGMVQTSAREVKINPYYGEFDHGKLKEIRECRDYPGYDVLFCDQAYLNGDAEYSLTYTRENPAKILFYLTPLGVSWGEITDEGPMDIYPY